MEQQEKVSPLADAVGLAPNDLSAYELLDDEQIEHLVQALREAEERQSTALEEAIQQALSFVPAMMRRPILKILGRKG